MNKQELITSKNNMTSMLYDSLSPQNRLSALGLLIRVLDNERSSHSDCFICCPDGAVISYEQSMVILEEMVAKIANPAKYGAV